MNGPTLEVHLEGQPGSIPARAFLDVFRRGLDVLEQLERAERPQARQQGSWLIAELRNESATATLWRPDAPELQTPSRLIDGVGQLRLAEGLPPYFSTAVVKELVEIGKRGRGKGLSGVSFRVPPSGAGAERAEQITETVIAHAQASIEGTDRAIGSVAGILDVINLRRGAHQVSLYDDDTRRAVRCRFPDELFAAIRDALGKHVRALGELTRNRSGQVLGVDIERIEVLEETPAVPTVDELAGIAEWYTGDQSTDDYLRSVRGA
ncbi:MAG: hypothetical protein ACYC1D_00850 [Acidimicrobiales bacterium]